MSLALAFTNLFSTSTNFGIERQRQRYVSEPIHSHDEEQPDDVDEETTMSTSTTSTPTIILSRENSTSTDTTGTTVENSNNNATDNSSPTTAAAAAAVYNSTAINMVEVSEEDEVDPFMTYATAAAVIRRRSSTAATVEEEDDDLALEEGDDDGGILNENDNTATATAIINGTTLAELEEERELARRRSSACSMLAVFILFRLWISCLQQGDLTLFLLCLLGTSWTVRWIRYNREREEELDYRISQYIVQQQQNNTNPNGGGGENTSTGATGTTRAIGRRSSRGGGIVMDRNELRMLSFQAQLSLAIMESQRHMMETGGYGRGTDDHPTTPGVSDHAKTFWKRFSYKSLPTEDDKIKVNSNNSNKKPAADDSAKGQQTDMNNKLYGSISSLNPSTKKTDKLDDYNDELPHCSICLGDYEDGEDLVQLPCGHLYHDSCIASWTSSHTKCPLCNLDLESVASAANNKNNNNRQRHSGPNNSNDSIV